MSDTASMSNLQFVAGHRGLHVPHRVGRIGTCQHGIHLGAVRVAEGQTDQEPVPLSVGKGGCPRGIEGVLGGQDEERTRQRVGRTVDTHLAFLHRLE